MVQTFIEDTFQTRHNAIMKSSEWLSRQLDDIRAKMENLQPSPGRFQATVGIADVEGRQEHLQRAHGRTQPAVHQAEAERIQIQSLLKNMQNGNPDSLPEVRNNPVVQQLSQKLAEQRG